MCGPDMEKSRVIMLVVCVYHEIHMILMITRNCIRREFVVDFYHESMLISVQCDVCPKIAIYTQLLPGSHSSCTKIRFVEKSLDFMTNYQN